MAADIMRDYINTTTLAFDGERAVYFTDAVREGEVVHVYASFEQAERQRGHFERRVVRRVDGEWRLCREGT